MKAPHLYLFTLAMLLAIPLYTSIATETPTSTSAPLDNSEPNLCGVSISSKRAWLRVNDNDHNADDKWDMDVEPIPYEQDTLQISVTGTADKSDATVTVTITGGGDKIEGFWKGTTTPGATGEAEEKAGREKNVDRKFISFQVPKNSSVTQTLYIEGIQHSDTVGDVTIIAEINAPGDTATPPLFNAGHAVTDPPLALTVYQVDLDVDSDNNQAWDPPAGTPQEDQIEASASDTQPGKIISSSLSTDTNGDNIPDYQNGVDGQPIIEGAKFVPMLLTLPDPYDSAAVTITLRYDEAQLGATASSSGLRVWRTDASTERTTAKDLISSGVPKTWADLDGDSGAESKQILLYIEAINTVGTPLFGKKKISVTADLNGKMQTDDLVNIFLVSADVALDSNRDGEITFGDQDKTSIEKPFRFWVNNDQDNAEVDEPSQVTKKDCDDTYITTQRDLEDSCRLKLKVGLPIEDLKEEKFKVAIKISPTRLFPNIRVWKNENPAGSLTYLTHGEAAQKQVLNQHYYAGDNVYCCLIPPSHWRDNPSSEVNLLFEGVSEGLGRIKLVILNANSEPIAEIDGPFLHLLDIQNMYQRAKVTKDADEIPNPWVNDNPALQQWVWTSNDHPYVEDSQAEPLACIFVHGWRMSYAEYLSWGNTSFKRLWHQGYKGKFYAFRWATYDKESSTSPATFTYNPSEYRAWLCGPALASFVNELPHHADQKRIFAHSMGNVITGVALRNGMIVQKYSLCNAAMSASAYDTNPSLRKDQDGNDLDLIGDRYTPDTDPDPAYRTAFGLQDKFNNASFPRMFNFGLPNDYALGVWTSNNFLWKPEANLNYAYSRAPTPRPTYELRVVTSLPEAMGYVTKSLTRTAGADLRTNGKIVTDFHDMSNWTKVGNNHGGFGSEHSAEWIWNYQSTNLFWKRLIETLNLKSLN